MKLLLFITTLFSGLVAGLLYAYSCSVNPGLKTLSNAEYIKAMQSINIAIQNPLFFISFIGLLLLLPIVVYQQYATSNNNALLIAAMLIYFIAVFGITMFGNVPLNNQLAKFSVSTAAENEIAAMRKTFENPWNTLHSIRTMAAVVSFGLMLLFILKKKN